MSALLIDKARLTRECLGQQLQECCPDLNFHMVVSLDDASLAFMAVRPDIVILNTHSGSVSAPPWAEHIRWVRSRSSLLLVIVECIDAREAEAVAKGELCGLFPAHGSVKLLAAAIRLILAGGRFMPPMQQQSSSLQQLAARASIDEKIGPAKAGKAAAEDAPSAINQFCSAATFTARENEILECLRRGLQNKNIAYDLGLSESTVKAHLGQIMRKLRAANRTEVVFRLFDRSR